MWFIHALTVLVVLFIGYSWVLDQGWMREGMASMSSATPPSGVLDPSLVPAPVPAPVPGATPSVSDQLQSHAAAIQHLQQQVLTLEGLPAQVSTLQQSNDALTTQVHALASQMATYAKQVSGGKPVSISGLSSSSGPGTGLGMGLGTGLGTVPKTGPSLA
jgi:hypothetical protein